VGYHAGKRIKGRFAAVTRKTSRPKDRKKRLVLYLNLGVESPISNRKTFKAGPDNDLFTTNMNRLTWRHALLVGASMLHLFLEGHASALDPGKSVFQFSCLSWFRQNGLPADRINAITR